MGTPLKGRLTSEKMCRACLSTKNNLKELTDTDLDYERFLNIYKVCTAIELKEFHTCPLYFCETCILRVEEFYTFRETCLQSHTTIQSLLVKAAKAVVKDENDFCESNNNSTEEFNYVNVCDIKNEKDEKAAVNDENDCFVFNNSTKEFDYVNVFDIKNKMVDTNVQSQFEYSVKCIICCETFKDVKTLNKHNELNHCTKDYKCALCEEIFNNPFLLTEHVKTHKKALNNSDVKIFGCSRCDKLYKTISNLQIHVYSHLGLRPYKCRYCPKDFTKITALRAHLDVHSGVRKFLCAECGKSYSSALLLKRHQMSHTGSKPFKCKLCPSSFAVTRDLSIHMRTHTGEKPYLCSACGKAFKRISHLNVHKRIHTGEKPYKCSYCDRCFTQSGDWRAHERTHTGIKPYICTICQKGFSQSSGLTTHMKKHEDKRFKCEFCGRVFVRAKSFEKHSLLHMGARATKTEVLCDSQSLVL
jgi:uncharacterized Zn-finger protein